MTNEELTIELQHAYRCIQGLNNALKELKKNTPSHLALTVGAAKRYVYEDALDGSQYFVGKHVSVLHEALALGSKPIEHHPV